MTERKVIVKFLKQPFVGAGGHLMNYQAWYEHAPQVVGIGGTEREARDDLERKS